VHWTLRPTRRSSLVKKFFEDFGLRLRLRENFDRFNSQIYKEKEMADFRRCILAFAVVALLLGLIPTASAQVVNGVQCIANSGVPPTVRSEGLTELTGDIVLNCSGGTPTPVGQFIPQANITIFLNTQVTSRLLSGSQSEAVLTVDEPTVAQTSPLQTCVTNTGCAAVAAGPNIPGAASNSNEFKFGFSSTTGLACPSAIAPPLAAIGTPVAGTCYINPNVFQGTVSGNSVTFVGIPIDPPGTSANRIYRITNIRANATIPAPGGSGTPGQIIALISATPATNPGSGTTSSFAINNPTQIIGFVQTSLTTSLTKTGSTTALASGDIGIRQCISRSTSAEVGQLNYTELFPTAFKTRTVAGTSVTAQNTLGLVYNSESGYYNPISGTTGLGTPLGTNGGLADFGTRLKAVFNNVPNGVSIFVSVSNTGFATTANPVAGTAATLTSSETGAFSPVSATTGSIWQVPIVNGSGTAIWEVTAANPLVNQTYSFLYYALATASPATNSPAVGTGTVNMSYAPIPPSFAASAGATASSTLPIPRFIDTSTAVNAIAVSICRTNLLFPFVTNSSGFDTGLAISNTSTDPFGTAAQQGPCTLNFYGSNAPAAVTTQAIASATTYTNLASLAAPNFQGYVIAVCNFQYAHGFAFVSDLGARNLAMGYLALIIPDPPRAATAFPCVGTTGITCSAAGEQLGY
jgi:hypothetical protein